MKEAANAASFIIPLNPIPPFRQKRLKFVLQFVPPLRYLYRGGKSGQHRAPCYLTGRRDGPKSVVTDSVTETIPPANFGLPVRVKKRGKSPLCLQ